MASIRKDIVVEVGEESAWDALRRVAEPHTLFAPVLTSSSLEGDVRTVQFANGLVVRERILDVDEEHRRVAYAVVEPLGMTYHHASMEIGQAGPGRCSFVWITDFMPAEAAAGLQPLIDQGAAAFKQNLERATATPQARGAAPSVKQVD